MSPTAHILVIPFDGQGHLFPSIELCKRLSDYKTTLIIPSSLSSSVPLQHPHFDVSLLTPSPPPESGPHHHHPNLAQPFTDLLSELSTGPDPPKFAIIDIMCEWAHQPCQQYSIPTLGFFTSSAASASIEFALGKIPPNTSLTPDESISLPGLPEHIRVSLADIAHLGPPPDRQHHLDEPPEFGPGPGHPRGPPPPQFRSGLGNPPPHSIAHLGPPPDRQHHHDEPPEFGPGPGHPRGPPPPQFRSGLGNPPPDSIAHMGPPPDSQHPHDGPPEYGPGPGHLRGPRPPRFRSGLGNPPPWASHSDNSIALVFNTCDDLERPFVDYLRKEIVKPIFCLGPLLPERFSSSSSIMHDHDLRSKRDQNNIHEDEVSQWLDTKPRGSVLYISFGSEVTPSAEELTELEVALDESNRPYIWVIQSGAKRPGPPRGPPVAQNPEFIPAGILNRAEGRGLVIRGWAPQLLILSHRSTSGFITHCGWNSTLEAISRGVPMLTWPIRGDQPYNAKLIVDHLKVGLMIKSCSTEIERTKKDDILNGIEKLMADEGIKKAAASLARTFEKGMSRSYKSSMDSFRRFIEGHPRMV